MATRLLALCALVIPASWASAAEGDDLLGHWATDGEESHVLIYKDEDSGTYHGKLVWFLDPVYEEGDPEEGKALRDRENPDKALQNTPLLGLVILKDFSFNAGDQEWSDGTIYDPERGKTYKCVIKFGENSDVLDVRGYIGIPALGRSTVWNRAEPKEEE